MKAKPGQELPSANNTCRYAREYVEGEGRGRTGRVRIGAQVDFKILKNRRLLVVRPTSQCSWQLTRSVNRHVDDLQPQTDPLLPYRVLDGWWLRHPHRNWRRSPKHHQPLLSDNTVLAGGGTKAHYLPTHYFSAARPRPSGCRVATGYACVTSCAIFRQDSERVGACSSAGLSLADAAVRMGEREEEGRRWRWKSGWDRGETIK